MAEVEDIDAADRARDARLRYRALRLVNSARSLESGMAGRRLCDLLGGGGGAGGDEVEDDKHLLELLEDLVNGGYVEIGDNRTHKRQRYGLDYLNVRPTARGTRFLAGDEEPDALIDDGRIVQSAQRPRRREGAR